MKAFSIFLQEINAGQTHAALTSDLAELLQAVKAHGRAGKLTLTIKVVPGSRGTDVDKITVTADRTLSLPKPELPTDFFWLTDTAEPTRKHPRQHDLDLRDAADDRPAAFKTAS